MIESSTFWELYIFFRCYAGSDACIFEWHLDRPGPYTALIKTRENRKSALGLHSLLSTLTPSQQAPSCLVAGTFQGEICVLDTRMKSNNYILFRRQHQKSNRSISQPEAVMQLDLSDNGYSLYATFRNSIYGNCQFDLRMITNEMEDHFVEPIWQSMRQTHTTQRLYSEHFIDYKANDWLIGGDSNGNLILADTHNQSIIEQQPLKHQDIASTSPISNVRLHPLYPLLFTAYGERLLYYDQKPSGFNLWILPTK
jgi:hypothetical protein